MTDDLPARLKERDALEAELASPYREVRVFERIAASIIRESLCEHVEMGESHDGRKVVCSCGEHVTIVFTPASSHREHQAVIAAAALADFSARESVTA